MKMWLREQPEVGAAMMSGSGSTMFAALREGADADALAARAKAELDPECGPALRDVGAWADCSGKLQLPRVPQRAAR